MKFYDKLPDMECLSGDTLPVFRVRVEGGSSVGASMYVILSHCKTPNVTALQKKCTTETGGFYVQLTSEDTASLTEDTYIIHFCMISNGCRLRKLAGELYVHSVPALQEEQDGS